MAKQTNSALPTGTKLQSYTIERSISTGGFSIVYLAHNEYGMPVAIKEFMPASLNLRNIGEGIQFKSPEDHRKFNIGLKSFFKEAQIISRFDTQNVVKIINFFLANNTAYLVMPYEHGTTLQKKIIQEDEPLSDAFIQSVFLDVLQGLSLFHRHQMLHLDLKPSNIWLKMDNFAMLIDFGTSLLLSEPIPLSAPMHTPGFAAPEQHKVFYAPEKIGTWTDIYNLGATIYACIEGEPPPNAEERIKDNHSLSFAKRWDGLYNLKMLQLVESMLELDYKKRPQSISDILYVIARYRPLVPQNPLEELYAPFFSF